MNEFDSNDAGLPYPRRPELEWVLTDGGVLWRFVPQEVEKHEV